MHSIKTGYITIDSHSTPYGTVLENLPTSAHLRIASIVGTEAVRRGDDTVISPRVTHNTIAQLLHDCGVVLKPYDTVASTHNGVMIAYYPPPNVTDTLWVDGGEDKPNIHMTLAYLGKLDTLPADVLSIANTAIRKAVTTQAVLSGEISGFGVFTNGESPVLYASVDVPGLPQLHHNLCAALNDAGITAKQTHGFSPHITIKYLTPNENVAIKRFDPIDISIDSIWVVSGDTERLKIEFGHKAEAFNVQKIKRIRRERELSELNTILDNTRDKHVTEPNVLKIKTKTGLDPLKPQDYAKLRHNIDDLLPRSITTNALERQIRSRLQWW